MFVFDLLRARILLVDWRLSRCVYVGSYSELMPHAYIFTFKRITSGPYIVTLHTNRALEQNM